MGNAPSSGIALEVSGPDSQQRMMDHEIQTVLQKLTSRRNRAPVPRTGNISVGYALNTLQIVRREKNYCNSYECADHSGDYHDSTLPFNAKLPNADCHSDNNRQQPAAGISDNHRPQHED